MQIHIHADMKNTDDFNDSIRRFLKEDIVLGNKGFIIPDANGINRFYFRSTICNGLEAAE